MPRGPPHARTFFVLDLLLDLVDGVGGLDFERDGLAKEGLDVHQHPGATTTWHTQAQPSFSFSFEPLTCTVTQATRWRQDSRTSTATTKHHSERERERERDAMQQQPSEQDNDDRRRKSSLCSLCSLFSPLPNPPAIQLNPIISGLLEMGSDHHLHRSDAHDGLSSM